MTAVGDGWWRWEPPAARAHGAGTAYPHRLRVRARRGRARPARPAQRVAAARRPRSEPHVRRGRLRLERRRLARTPFAAHGVLGGVVYELHVGTFTAGGHPRRRRWIGSTTSSRLGVDVVELMPVAAVPRPVELGLRRRRALCRARRLRRPGRRCSGSSTPATPAGWGSASTSCTTTSVPAATTSRGSGPYFTSAHETPWGPAVNLDHEGSEHVRRLPRRERRALVPRLPRRRPAPRRRPRAEGRLAAGTTSPSCPTPWPPWSAELGRPLDLVAESDLNDPVMVTPTSEGGRGMTAQWDDDVHHALHVALTGERHGYYADFAGGGGRDEAGPLAVLAKVLTRGFLHDGTLSTFRGRPWGRPVDVDAASTPGGCSATCRRTTRSATGWRATASPRPSPPGLQAAGAALYLLAPDDADDLHGRGVGRVDAVAVLHELRGGGARGRRAARAAGRVRVARLVRGRGAGPAGPGDPRPVGARLGRGARSRPRRGCCAGTPRAPACAASCSASARRGSPTSP